MRGTWVPQKGVLDSVVVFGYSPADIAELRDAGAAKAAEIAQFGKAVDVGHSCALYGCAPLLRALCERLRERASAHSHPCTHARTHARASRVYPPDRFVQSAMAAASGFHRALRNTGIEMILCEGSQRSGRRISTESSTSRAARPVPSRRPAHLPVRGCACAACAPCGQSPCARACVWLRACVRERLRVHRWGAPRRSTGRKCPMCAPRDCDRYHAARDTMPCVCAGVCVPLGRRIGCTPTITHWRASCAWVCVRLLFHTGAEAERKLEAYRDYLYHLDQAACPLPQCAALCRTLH